ncbi:hypothetical protein [Deinococcus petrolearius]|uniref:WD-40 repeat protein n=1 Tax=Deinococcus petrolearius TaxID=1751295 RepID=A0ABW1DFR9_9DEIO
MWGVLLTLGLFVDEGLGNTVGVPFGGAGTVAVPRPPDMGLDPPPRAQPPLYSPRGDAAALRFCRDIPKYSTCQVFLVRPGLPTRALPRSDVQRLLWSPDGRFLIGAGANTVRLWNLAGGVRAQVPQPPGAGATRLVRTRTVTGLHLRRGELCVSLLADVFRKSGGPAVAGRTATFRYALPALRPAERAPSPPGRATPPPATCP